MLSHHAEVYYIDYAFYLRLEERAAPRGYRFKSFLEEVAGQASKGFCGEW